MLSTDRPIRIAVMSKPLDNWKSGSGHHLDELMRHVLDLNDGSIDFTFVHYRKSDNDVYNRVREIIIPRNPFRASRILARENFDIIHYSPLSAFAPIWGIAAKKTATVHGIEERLFPKGYSLVHRLHEYYIQPWYMRRMDGIATVSETGRKYFIDHYRIAPEKIFITTNGLAPGYRRLESGEKELTDLPAIDRKFVLHLSNYSERKNPATVINGFAAFVGKTGADLQLVCAGKGWNGEEARMLAEKAGIAERYVAPGFISENAAVRLLNNAEAFLFPSFAEGFGMPNVEAMACGCPVITSNVFAIPEIVGNAAVVLSRPDATGELADALAKIVFDAGYKKALVERGLEQCKKYRWEDSARAILSYWKALA